MTQVARHQGRRVFAFTRPGDAAAQSFARSLGAAWAGDSTASPPEPLDAAFIFAPVGDLVPLALARRRARRRRRVRRHSHESEIPALPYRLLWGERVVRSVANLTRRDGTEFLRITVEAGVRSEAHPYSLARAAEALDDLRHGRFTGAAVLVPGG